MADDSDVSLPRTTIQKMIKDLVPPDMRIANDTVDLVIACCTEFIQLMSSESNDVATRENRSIIHPDHVLRALTELGFQSFVGEVTMSWNNFKEDAKTAHSRKADLRKTGAEHAGLSEEEQILLQQQMFAQARAQSMTTSESAAAMHAAYEQAMAAQQHAQAGPGAAHPQYPYPQYQQQQQQAGGSELMQQRQSGHGPSGGGGGGGGSGGGGGPAGASDMEDDDEELDDDYSE
ncbi:hypothetical protein PLESTB_000857200 [Pleodorina starrii]|uniref:Transcription factor CBF/NF-Y/archaeal histone domain-containing protein n=1 Tax=Pleodorina starrii TaxID=330485 RepID=A0A9W6F3I8_9CHLO|nr:hypothetical protein PLESTM_001436600 [Pleodorina starrii]GLC54376.1 hypothetical protein PLESTB_000857200 [Pleodorina starrii]